MHVWPSDIQVRYLTLILKIRHLVESIKLTASFSSGPIQNYASRPTATPTAMAGFLPLKQRPGSRIDSKPCAPSSCPTPSCTVRSSSISLWFCLSFRSNSKQQGYAWGPPSSWTTWTLSASPSPQPSQATPHRAAGGLRGQARRAKVGEREASEEGGITVALLNSLQEWFYVETERWQILFLCLERLSDNRKGHKKI